jgi:hypothetical protein
MDRCTDRDARRTARFADHAQCGFQHRDDRKHVAQQSDPRPDAVTITDGRIYLRTDPARGETYQDVLRRRGLQTLDAHQTYTPDDANKIQHGVRQRMVDLHSRRWIRSFDLHHQLASAIPTGIDVGGIRRRPGRPTSGLPGPTATRLGNDDGDPPAPAKPRANFFIS